VQKLHWADSTSEPHYGTDEVSYSDVKIIKKKKFKVTPPQRGHAFLKKFVLQIS
jgi:hypothetical protein